MYIQDFETALEKNCHKKSLPSAAATWGIISILSTLDGHDQRWKIVTRNCICKHVYVSTLLPKTSDYPVSGSTSPNLHIHHRRILCASIQGRSARESPQAPHEATRGAEEGQETACQYQRSSLATGPHNDTNRSYARACTSRDTD